MKKALRIVIPGIPPESKFRFQQLLTGCGPEGRKTVEDGGLWSNIRCGDIRQGY